MLFKIKKGEKETKSGFKVLLGDEILVRVTDLPKNQEVKIHTRRIDDKNQLWYSYATFISNHEGNIDLGKSEAISGTYKGTDPVGLFWSMEPVSDKTALPENLTTIQTEDPEKIFLYFDIEIDGEIVAFKNMETVKMLPEVKCEHITVEGLVASFYYPSGKDNLPTVIVVSGSEGGIATPDIVAGLLASKGYAALALAYFEMPGLPEILEEIPLDYIEKAINWILNHKVVNREKIAMMGTSKGAELTLLTASTFPQIKAALATSPSCAVFQSLNPDPSASPKSSWMYRGKPLPFVPFIYTDDFLKQFSSGYPKHLEFLPLYQASLKDEEAVEKAVIRVENIHGPILLISSDDDRVWPSKKMSEMIVGRLKEHEFPFKYQHLSYDGAGHMAARPGYMPWPTPFYVKGGSPQRNGQVQVDIWKAVLKFFDELFK